MKLISFFYVIITLQDLIKAATDSIIFQGSEILTQQESVSLQNLIGFSLDTNFTLIYQASRDGYKISNFHEKCDNILNTLIIIKTNTSKVIGFFTTKDWGTSQFWQNDKYAFLFTFKNQFNTPARMKILNADNAMRANEFELNFGYEIIINDNFNQKSNFGWSGLNNSYELPSFVNNVGYLLVDSDSSSFYSSEIETYEVNACWSSPCLNNGICKKAVNNRYECTCINGYFGLNCQTKLLDSTIFQNTTILTQQESVLLQQLLNFTSDISFNLIYQATRDGFSLNDFHSKCDGILNTLMIIKTTESYVFGGFTTKDWGKVSGYQDDTNAFIFSFINPLSQSTKMSIIDSSYAIYQGPDLINNVLNDFIGFGKNDILINDNSNLQSSYVNITSFKKSSSLENDSFFLNGGAKFFKTLEIEVYLVDPCWNTPCMNDGTCQSQGGNYECKCKSSFYGPNCQSKALNSTIHKNSNILTQEQSFVLHNITKFPSNTVYTLIYQATRDGFSLNDFHSKCDGILNTLMIIKTTESYVFGGFTTKDLTATDDYQTDSNAFLFSLINPFDKPVKMTLALPDFAIKSEVSSINFGYEIFLSDNSNLNAATGWSDSMSSYNLPDFVNSTGYLLIGDNSEFYSSEIEVYSLNLNPCSFMPCLNGAQCTVVKSTYSCKCVNGYSGINCDVKRLNSTIFQNTTILTQQESVLLQQLLNFTSDISFNLIYQATRDGFSLNDFHSKCDGILNTLMIIKTTESYVFGGFTTKDWGKVSGYQDDTNAFIFSFINPLNESTKMNINDSDNAIYNGQDYINRFYSRILGFGNDILLNDFSNKYPNYAWPALDSFYQIPDFVDGDVSSFNNKETDFLTTEIEVYAVNINPCYYADCLNDGVCLPTKYNYKCICNNQFYGASCESKVLDSQIFINSSILSQEQSVKLKSLLQFGPEINFTLIYQASRDGFGLKDFHRKCDGIFNTLIVIQTTDSYILGGFTSNEWTKKMNETDIYRYDNNAFLFSLTNPLNETYKMNIVKSDLAIYMGLDHIDNIFNEILGFGQTDLFLNDYSNVNLNYGWIDGLSYALPQSLQSNGSLLVDGEYFLTSQFEVFVVDACWSSPCLNGGTCKTFNFSYICICKNNFNGKNCNKKISDSTIFQNTTILTQQESVLLQQLLNFTSDISFNLIYQATRDGFSLNDFHSKCDGILNTLMIIKTTESYVFGGFTTKDWGKVSGYQDDTNAFIFSFINPLNQSTKMSIIDSSYAIYQGPNFVDYDYNDFIGFGKNDILINDNSNLYLSTAWASSVSTFNLPQFVNNNVSLLLGGKSNFLTVEIEVYTLAVKQTKINLIRNAAQCRALVPCLIQPIFEVSNLNLTNNVSMIVQSKITYSTNQFITLIYETETPVINRIAKFSNFTVSNFSSQISIIFTVLEFSGLNSFGLKSLSSVSQTLQVATASFKCASLIPSISVLPNDSFNLTFSIVDFNTNTLIPSIVWKKYNWQANVSIFSLAFYPPSGSLITNSIIISFDPTSSYTYFNNLKLNKTGMYILSIKITSNEKSFNSQCRSNPIRVVKMLKNASSETNKPNYVFKFKATDFAVFTSDEENKIKASIYNCMEKYNITVSELLLNSTNNPARKIRRDSSSVGIVTIKFYSNDTNSNLYQNLSNLNISNILILISATINGVTYGEVLTSTVSDNNVSSKNITGIIVGCIFGGLILIILIGLGLYCFRTKRWRKYLKN